MNARRQFLAALGGILAGPRFALAQPAERIYRLGWLASASLRAEPYNIAFEQRLRELGYVEGRNLVIEYRGAGGRVERLPELAADLGRQNCDVFLAAGPEATLVAFKQATQGTPIVAMANDYDLVATGHIASLARPGGRITGISQLQVEVPAKRLELLKELIPKIKRVAVFSDTSSAGQLATVRTAATRLDIALNVHEFQRVPYDYDAAFVDVKRTRAGALLVLVSGLFVPARRQIPELALKHRLPSMFGNYLWAEAGGLLSYGPNFSDLYRRGADQVAMILKGAKPAEMPVEQASAFELVLNLKTAKGLGLTIAPSFRLRADRVIE